ncbi:MAG: TIGR03619 family F420-dependent LLM class oxidoreductase [Gammaproteobacteria bacterium]|nr:TIGR03619 family F420-dependent LLM class oxidoreductase [Gammaproteobacteria bacterium]
MKLGLFGINMNACCDPDTTVQVARTAEAAGFESLWTGEHVVLPDPQVAPSPLPPLYPLLDPAVALAFIAAHTKTVKLGTGIIILPQRNPLVLAKELASVDVLSKGRLIFGLGVGYLKPEFEALGVSFEHKGARAIDYLQAMQAIWSQPQPGYTGKFVIFNGIQARPQPIQQALPIVIGGHTKAAFLRAVEYAHGWYGFALDEAATQKCLDGLAAAAREVSRPAALGPLEISVTPAAALDRDLTHRYRDLGVHRLIPFPRLKTAAELVAFVSRTADACL